MSKKQKAFRTQYLSYPNFQMILILINSLMMILVAAIIAVSAKTAFAHFKAMGIQIHLYANHPFFSMLESNAKHFYNQVAITLLFSLVFSNGLIIYFSHKMTGPIVHLENYFRSIVRRERAPRSGLRFRDGDYFRDLPHTINSAVGILRSGVSEDTQTTASFRRAR